MVKICKMGFNNCIKLSGRRVSGKPTNLHSVIRHPLDRNMPPWLANPATQSWAPTHGHLEIPHTVLEVEEETKAKGEGQTEIARNFTEKSTTL